MLCGKLEVEKLTGGVALDGGNMSSATLQLGRGWLDGGTAKLLNLVRRPCRQLDCRNVALRCGN